MLSTDIFGAIIIDRFDDDKRFLSNFFPAKVTLWGIEFDTSEHAYQWSKTFDETEKLSVLFKIQKRDRQDGEDRVVPTSPGDAKRAGASVTKRPDWEDVRFDLMVEILMAKFSQNLDLKARLLATGDALLIEGNTWHDNTWGVCTCGTERCKGIVGLNLLGKALMEVRRRLQ